MIDLEAASETRTFEIHAHVYNKEKIFAGQFHFILSPFSSCT